LCIAAPMTASFDFPLANNRSQKVRIKGLERRATKAGIYNTFRKLRLPILDNRGLPYTEEPEPNSLGVKPAKAANWSALSTALKSRISAKIAAAVAAAIPGIETIRGKMTTVEFVLN
jgi:hypothetical protein